MSAPGHDKKSFYRNRTNNNTGQHPLIVADTPEVLRRYSRNSVDLNRGLVWIKTTGGQAFSDGEAFSLNFWFKPAAFPDEVGYLVTANRSWRLGYFPASGRMRFENLRDSAMQHSGKTGLDIGRWQMITLVVSAEQICFYVDGKLSAARTPGQTVAPFLEVFLGADGGHGVKNFEGRLDDFTLYSRVLSAAEVSALAAGIGPIEREAPPERIPGVGLLKRTLTEPFPAELAVGFMPRESLSLARDGAIIRVDSGALEGRETEVQREIRRLWDVTLPIMSAEDAVAAGKTLVLFGPGRGNMPLLRLGQIRAIDVGQVPGVYEARVYPQLLDYPAGLVYFGGADLGETVAAAERIAEEFPDPDQLSFFVERQDRRGEKADAAWVNEMVESLRAYLENPDDRGPNQTAIRLFRPVFDRFLQTGDSQCVAALRQMQSVYLEDYDRNKTRFGRMTAPSFLFHEYVWRIEVMLNSPHMTREDRALTAELMRRVSENCFEHYEMRKPMADYARGVRNYHTNHMIFASRTVYFIADNLLRNYDYEPARYWKDVAANTLAAVEPHPVSLEDSARYQYLNYNIFTTYALASGSYGLEFFRRDNYRDYVAFCKAQYSHLGMTTGHGDNPALGNASTLHVLAYAALILGDTESEALLGEVARQTEYGDIIAAKGVRLDLPFEMTDELVGLAVFPVTDFVLEQNDCVDLFPQRPLDKAFFRSGWTADSDFLGISGISDGHHGHYEANGILQYIHGGNLFLTDGDYLRRYPEEQNTLHVSRDGESRFAEKRWGEQRHTSRFSQLLFHGMTADRRLAMTAAKVADLNGMDWTRTIAYAAKKGFWVLDQLEAKTAGNYLVDCRWRSLGDYGNVSNSMVEILQRDATNPEETVRLMLAGGGGERLLSTRFDTGHGGENGYYADYAHAGPYTRNIVYRLRGDLALGDTRDLVTYIQVREPGDERPAPRLHRIGAGAWLLLNGDETRLAVLGEFRADGVDIAARRCVVGPEGVIGDGVTRLRFADETPALVAAGSLTLTGSAGRDAVLSSLRALATPENVVTVAAAPPVAAPVVEPRVLAMEEHVTALGAAEDVFAAGLADGRFRVFDATGAPLFSHALGAAVRAIGIIATEAGNLYVVGTEPLQPQAGGAPAPLYCFGPDGHERWRQELSPFQRRNGTAKTIFAAHFSPDRRNPSLIVGAENQAYVAMDLDGNEIWSYHGLHGATAGLAADLDADGLDEVVAGSEYYYTPILNSRARKIQDRLVGPWITGVIAVDLDGDGNLEVIAGRSNHALDLHALKQGSDLPAPAVRLGGEPTALIAGPGPRGAAFGATARDGRIRFFDGQLAEVCSVDVHAPALGLAAFAGGWLVVAEGDWLYRIAADGTVACRYPVRWDPTAHLVPQPVGLGRLAVAAVGRNLYLVTAE